MGGGTPSTSVKEYWNNGNIIWVTPAYMSKLNSNYINTSDRKITNLGLNKSSAKLMPAGSVIMSSRAPIGYLAINTVPACTSQGCKSLVPYNLKMSAYLLYVIKASVNRIIEASKGTTFDEISGTKFGNILIPIAPINEEIRICHLIENISRIIINISSQYTSINKYVLVAKQKVLDSIFGPDSSYKSYYTEKKLFEVANIVFGQSPSGDEISDVSKSNSIEFHQGKLYFGKKYLLKSPKNSTNSPKTTNGNSVVMSVRAPVGDVNICNRIICIGRGLCSIEPKENISSEYLYYYLLTKKKSLIEIASGSTFSAIKSNDVKNINILLCDETIQKKIVEDLTNAFKLIEMIVS